MEETQSTVGSEGLRCEEQRNSGEFDCLPNEILEILLSYCEPHSLVNIRMTCRRLYYDPDLDRVKDLFFMRCFEGVGFCYKTISVPFNFGRCRIDRVVWSCSNVEEDRTQRTYRPRAIDPHEVCIRAAVPPDRNRSELRFDKLSQASEYNDQLSRFYKWRYPLSEEYKSLETVELLSHLIRESDECLSNQEQNSLANSLRFLHREADDMVFHLRLILRVLRESTVGRRNREVAFRQILAAFASETPKEKARILLNIPFNLLVDGKTSDQLRLAEFICCQNDNYVHSLLCDREEKMEIEWNDPVADKAMLYIRNIYGNLLGLDRGKNPKKFTEEQYHQCRRCTARLFPEYEYVHFIDWVQSKYDKSNGFIESLECRLFWALREREPADLDVNRIIGSILHEVRRSRVDIHGRDWQPEFPWYVARTWRCVGGIRTGPTLTQEGIRVALRHEGYLYEEA